MQTLTSCRTKPAVPKRSGYVAIIVGFAVVAAAILAALWINRGSGGHSARGAVVGPDLHAVFMVGDRTFASGHEGAGYSDDGGAWVQIASLENKDVMGWALTPDTLLVGGHAGLYLSNDNGASFEQAAALPAGTDVHAVGAAAKTVYLSSPTEGLLVSTDSGQTFTRRGSTPAMMGSILVDPENPDRAVAPDMQYGALETMDGGRRWKPLGGPASAISVAWNPHDRDEIVSVGMDTAGMSADGGRTWEALPVPSETAALTYTPSGIMVAAVLFGERAQTYRLLRGHWILMA